MSMSANFTTFIFVTVVYSTVLLGCQIKDHVEKIAEVDGEVIVMGDVEKAGARELYRLRDQLYKLEREKLEDYIDSLLLKKEAQRRRVSIETLLEGEIESKILPVTDSEITVLYNANKSRIPVPLDKVRDKIREFIRRERISAQRSLFVKSLREKAQIVNYLAPPPMFRAQISVGGAPFKGADKAAVTMVKFEDFHCPFCAKIQPVFAELLSRYRGKLKIVHRDFPIDSLHPAARRAHEAARCANEQGKFWAYHDVVYTNAPKAEPDDLKAYAKTVGLDVQSFEQCLTSGKFTTAVQEDIDEAMGLGISGTPASFINGRELSGARPIEEFIRIIDEELARVGNS
jgi:protein-disulfide isomerase